MQQRLQNKLSAFEMNPPAGTWTTIATRLDDEYLPYDSILSARLENTEMAPPPASWNIIVAGIQQSKGRVIPLGFKRVAVAAAVIAAFAITALLIFSGNETKAPTQVAATIIPPVGQTKISESQNIPLREKQPAPAPAAFIASNTSGRRYRVPKKAVQQASGFYPTVQTVRALDPVQVKAPPIRDENGKIVIDHSLITSPGEPYITVTSPNGLQTRISTKFVNCLAYLYNSSPSYINNEELQWKAKFAEWRNKLLDESFVPTANNFFDIFELKEIIEEQ